ncbi:MAG: M13 family metallopeptidase [Eubacteriales bacterium]|nr:M13 family metallopeptidase [Eubacteriales bacterium]
MQTETVRLQDNYYDAVNHERIEAWEIPADRSAYGSLTAMQEKVEDRMWELIQNTPNDTEADPDSDTGRLSALYLTGMDMETRNREGYGILTEVISGIKNAKTVEELLLINAGINRRYGNSFLYNIGFGAADPEDSNHKVIGLGSVETGLEREIWLAEDEEDQKQAAYFTDYVQRLFELNGYSTGEAKETTEAVCGMMKEIAAAGLEAAEFYDPSRAYLRYTFGDLQKECPAALPDSVLKDVWGFSDQEIVTVEDIGALKKFSEYLTAENLDVLKAFMECTIYRDNAGFLTADMLDAKLDYEQQREGLSEKKSYEKTLLIQLNDMLASYECGRLYTETYMPEENKTEVEGIIRDIISVYHERIAALDWMSEPTKEKAIEKLDAISIQVAYPKVWEQDFYTVDLRKPEEGGLYIDNLFALFEARMEYMYNTRYDPVNRDLWVSQPQEVNAYYYPPTNSIYILAGIMQDPVYSADASYEAKLGAIGTVIGHELSHAFDVGGSQYDANGNVSNWWTEEDMNEFTARTGKVVDYYNEMGGRFQRVNGEQTLSENIADLGGMAVITELARKNDLDLTKVYEAYAVVWANKQRPDYASYLYLVDTHSPSALRVNAVLAATDAFYEVYDVKEGDGMYVAPESRPQIW